jgi:class 3 adenylate cyclase
MSYKKTIFTSASEDRLEKLVQERLQPGADKVAIDARIWDLFGEEWAIMFTDLSGFSRQVAKFGIIHFLQTIYESQRLLIPVIEDFDGILLKVEGDSYLVIFRNAQKAINAAINMQRVLKKYNADHSEEENVLLCVGIGFGKVLRIGDEDVFGKEVNSASKLGEDTAKAWEIIVTGAVKNVVGEMDEAKFEKIENVPAGIDTAFHVRYQL